MNHPHLQHSPIPPPGAQSGVVYPERKAENLVLPLEDPIAALKFCRALAAAMKSETESSQNHGQLALVDVMAKKLDAPIPLLSIVIPVFNEAENLPILHARLTEVLSGLGFEYEIVFVDDGSQDQSPGILRGLEVEDRRGSRRRVRQEFRTSSRDQRRA